MRAWPGVIVCWLFLLLSHSASAQSLIVSGTVTESADEPLPLASVILRDTTTGDILAFTTADVDGRFELTAETQMRGQLEISAFGFAPYRQWVDKSEVNLRVNLAAKDFRLQEVIVSARRKLEVNGDTVRIDAASYLRGGEEVIEDLLRNLPGVEVDADGTIRVGNREVEKVMVEGDDFFERGYKVLTKNMPVEAVGKVEVLNRYSNNRLLKGIESSDRVALNLVLKPAAKRNWFGKLEGGLGVGEKTRYAGRSNLMNFGKKNKYYLLSNLNNTGYDAVGDVQNLIQSKRPGEPGSIGDDQFTTPLIATQGRPPDFSAARTNFNNAELASLNAIFNPLPKLKVTTVGFLNWDEQNFSSSGLENFTLPNSTFTIQEDLRQRSRALDGFGKVDFAYRVSDKGDLKYTGRYADGSGNVNEERSFNGVRLSGRLATDTRMLDQKLSYTERTGERTVLLVTGRQLLQRNNQQSTALPPVFSPLFSKTPLLAANQLADVNQSFYGISAHLLRRSPTGHLWEIEAGQQFTQDRTVTGLTLNDTLGVRTPADFQNDLRFMTNQTYLRSAYRRKIGRVELVADGRLFRLRNRSLQQEREVTEADLYFNPGLAVDWKPNADNRLTARYVYETRNATPAEVLNGFYRSGYRTFTAGVGSPFQTNTSSYVVRYRRGNWTDKFFANFSTFYRDGHDYLSSLLTVAPSFQLVRNQPRQRRREYGGALEIDFYLKKVFANLGIDLDHSRSTFSDAITGAGEREIRTQLSNYGLEWRSTFGGPFNFAAGSKRTISTISASSEARFARQLSFLDLFYQTNKKLDAKINLERYDFSGNNTVATTYYFADLELRYKLRENKVSLSVKGRNLLNVKDYRRVAITDLATSVTTYQLLPGFLMLEAAWRL